MGAHILSMRNFARMTQQYSVVTSQQFSNLPKEMPNKVTPEFLHNLDKHFKDHPKELERLNKRPPSIRGLNVDEFDQLIKTLENERKKLNTKNH